MEFIQSVFNNREIAIAFWVIIVVTILIFTKAGKDFLKSVTPILFCKKFVIFYFVFISFLCLVIYGLYKIEIWSLKLVKDTIFWVMFVELPLFAKTIEEAKDARFFRKLIKDNIAISVAVEFLIGFWTFDLWVEILLIPFLVFISVLYAVAEREKKNKPAKSFLQGILTLLGVISFIYAIYNLVHFPQDFFSVDTLKVFVLPLILLILNLPVVYGLAIYNVYEQIFIHLKGTAREKRKMKVSLVLFAGINLHKLSMIRLNMHKTIIISLTNKELKDNLHKLQKELDSQIGDNYMKRSKFYVRVCIVALFVSVVGLIGVNAEVSIKDKALDRMEAVIQHNEADIRTWLPLEYELQLSYGEKEAAFSKVTEKLKEHANNDTIEKIEKAKFAGYVKEDISDAVLSDNIGIIRLVLGACFTNCYIVYNIRTNNCLIIDPADDAEKIIDNISKNGLKPQYILVTHGHTDHILALGALKEKYNIPVVISRIDAPRLLDEELINERPYVEVPYKAVYPSVLLGEGDEIWLDDIRFETMILPGHTPGSAAFKIDFKNSTGHRTDENKDTAAKYMDAENTIYQVGDSNEPDNIKGIIFTGDTMLAGGHGKTSLPGGNEEDMIKSLQRLKDIDGNYLIYPGHKEITTLKKERQ